MSMHSVADAKNHLSRLIDRALNGEAVVITRHGHPVVEIKSIKTARRAAREADLAWLDSKRVKLRGQGDDAVATLLKMRDEDWH
ncbi:MAG: type II toxin-antitoxin system Phd/YefM family antitoxin [Acetobacteraceae bacterium]|nr:type II toxin-antitoxin system Phd/YefM family antitoxin [Acetobacteraceae bacterium]